MMESGCILNINRNQVKIDVLVGDEKSIAINTEWRKGGVRITSSAQPRRVAPSKRYSGLRARIQKNLRPTNKSAPPRHLLLRMGKFHCAPSPWRAEPLARRAPDSSPALILWLRLRPSGKLNCLSNSTVNSGIVRLFT